jgi:hypothetical protein
MWYYLILREYENIQKTTCVFFVRRQGLTLSIEHNLVGSYLRSEAKSSLRNTDLNKKTRRWSKSGKSTTVCIFGGSYLKNLLISTPYSVEEFAWKKWPVGIVCVARKIILHDILIGSMVTHPTCNGIVKVVFGSSYRRHNWSSSIFSRDHSRDPGTIKK